MIALLLLESGPRGMWYSHYISNTTWLTQLVLLLLAAMTYRFFDDCNLWKKIPRFEIFIVVASSTSS